MYSIYANMQILLLLVLMPLHLSYGFYIRNANAAPANVDATADSRTDDWGVFQNRLGLSQEKGEKNYFLSQFLSIQWHCFLFVSIYSWASEVTEGPARHKAAAASFHYGKPKIFKCCKNEQKEKIK